jgi:hypothetical protein
METYWVVHPVNEPFNLLLRLVLRKTDAHRYMDVLTRRRGEILLFELRPDSFRRDSAVRACGHRQQNGEFFAAVTIGGIDLAQASFDHLTKSRQDLVSLKVTVGVVEPLEIVKIEKQQGYPPLAI